MTQYVLPADLSFCLIDQHPVFLDIAKDKYFRLSGSLEEAFLDWLSGAPSSASVQELLAEKGILHPRPDGAMFPDQSIPSPLHSALELPAPTVRLGLRTVAAVFVLVLLTRLQLNTIGLKATITRTFPDAPRLPALDIEENREAAVIEARRFLAARKLIPMDTSCLLDSLAMARFLTRTRLKTNIVFGVTGDPFSAHCWLQIGDIVLSDALGNVRTYTRIRIL